MISGYMMKTWQREGGKRGKKKKNPYTSYCCCCFCYVTGAHLIYFFHPKELNWITSWKLS